MSLEITVTQQHLPTGLRSCSVRLLGALDLASLPKAAPILGGLVATHPEVVVIDLAHLTFVDSSGIGLFLKTRLDLEAQGGKVFVANVPPSISKVFAIVQALPGASVFRDTREMDDYLKVMQERDDADE